MTTKMRMSECLSAFFWGLVVLAFVHGLKISIMKNAVFCKIYEKSRFFAFK